jgi:hypothetical protein
MQDAKIGSVYPAPPICQYARYGVLQTGGLTRLALCPVGCNESAASVLGLPHDGKLPCGVPAQA